MKKNLIKISALMMALILILCPLSVCFADDNPVPTPIPEEVGVNLWRDSALAIIWSMLKAWNIEVTYDELDYYTEEVGDQITNLVIEYLDTLPSVGSIISWTQLWSWGSDFWGNMRMNSSMLEDIQDFADWIIVKFGLDNNEEYVIDASNTINGYPVYNINQYYSCVGADGNTLDGYVALTVNSLDNGLIGYFTPYIVEWNRPTYVLIKTVKTNTSLQVILLDDNLEEVDRGNSGVSSSYLRNYGNLWFVDAGVMQAGRPWAYPAGEKISFANISALWSWLGNGVTISQEGDYRIITGNINLPSNDPSYTSGDGMTIVDGNPEYAQVVVVNPIQISNLPAIISTGSIPNPGFGDVFLPLKAFVNTFSDGMTIIKDVVFHLPTEALAIFYAIMSITVIFGALHMFKEH